MSAPGRATRTGPERPGLHPGPTWRWARRLSQSLMIAALLLSPLLGGWQRLDRTTHLATWEEPGLPAPVRGRLPLGDAPRRARVANRLVGGGIALELPPFALMDPVAGTLALRGARPSLRALVAIGLPVLLALAAGRVFCGWLCPFGILSRAVDKLLSRLPRLPRFRLPRRRPVRWLLLGAGVLGSLLGAELLLYLSLPYVLLQQSVYASWLLGGGSAVLAVLAGLVGAGLLFGPTVYCAALCPTGASLSLLGRARVVRLSVREPSACGRSCGLCSRACWLQLDPASGDPGPDCDLCARCVSSCPKTNLAIRAGRPRRRLAAGALAVLSLLAGLGGAEPAQAAEGGLPRLILSTEIRRDGGTLAVSVVDLTGVKLDADWAEAQQGIELSLFLTRGPLEGPGPDGSIPLRDCYRGPLNVRLERVSPRETVAVAFEAPNSPVSAQRRRIYRRRLPFQLQPGDRITVDAVPGWLHTKTTLTVGPDGTRVALRPGFAYFATALLGFSGLLSLAFVPGGGSRRGPRRGA